MRLFGERMMPVVSPKLVRRGHTPLAKPADLARHVLLHLDDSDGRTPWLEWSVWLAANGQPGLKPAGSLRFKLYDQLIQAAVGGQGVALGRIPLIAGHLRDGRLTAPFPKRYESARGYYAVVRRTPRSVPTSPASSRGSRRGAARELERAPPRKTAPLAARKMRRPRLPQADMTSERVPAPSHAARPGVGVGRALRAAGRGGGRVLDLACGDGRHARYLCRRAARASSRYDRDAAALATLARQARIATRARRSRGRTLAAGGRAFRRHRRRQLPAPAAVSLAARRAGGRRRAHLRDLRARQRSLRPAVESGLPAGTGELLQLAARGLTVVAFEQGVVATPEPGAVVQRLAAVGPEPSVAPGAARTGTVDGARRAGAVRIE